MPTMAVTTPGNNGDHELAGRLTQHAPEIIRRWERRAQTALPGARHQDRLVLIDNLPTFLAELAQAIARSSARNHHCPNPDASQAHGETRAQLPGYSLGQVLDEYHLLRKTLFEVLEAEAPLLPHHREAILDCLDRAVQQAASEYAKTQQEALRQQAEELAAAHRAKDEFLALLGHELRSPLGAIHNALQILDRVGSREESAVRQRGTIERQVRHLTRLADDLMDVARIANGSLELRQERLDLAAVATHAAQTSQPLIEARAHHLNLSLPRRPVWIAADPIRLEQVVTNLLTNAAKYTDPGGQIDLLVQQEAEHAV
jgi:signal transduction histidine kinase